ncbi:hypothetical protein NL532_29120 [Mesorhizobium sp. C120A]|uniref:hypothetical protein n=1 Tax=unclassified Mesorhizobium TaxID=325217 RepID=UPI0003CFF782|nr:MULTISPECIES: hypothetical protein [unclassified Mesorhizobium]ESZ57104.1 hypothetical protein X728_24585 [Mesorhizobium sp. L103C120A0]WJI44609.1 hypothetical protein NL532_29120 [Mesorhizobium sp. C120A]
MSERATSTKSKLTILETVYPPISNQEAVWLQNDPEVEALFRQSDFYVIAGRAEAKYLNLVIDPDTYVITFDFAIGDDFRDPVEIRIRDLPAVGLSEAESFWIEAGEKGIRVWDGPIGELGSNVLEWFTTEKLIWNRSRGRAGIQRFDRYREAATYDLLYVGIAKVGDSFDRLISNGHKARTAILGNEPQRYPGARVTDEIYLFLFNVQPLIMTTFEPEHDFEKEDFSGAYDHKRIVADAEKAFVSLLKPDYNVVRFASYPKGTDGLYGSDFVRYGYAICEAVSFDTPHGRIRGSRDAATGFITNDADSIFIEGNTVKLFVSGVDFPADPPLAATDAASQDNQKEEKQGVYDQSRFRMASMGAAYPCARHPVQQPVQRPERLGRLSNQP